MKSVNIIIALMLFSVYAVAQKENKHIRQGNKEYEEGRWAEAQTQYLRAIDKNNKSFGGAFNLGNALYKQQKYEEAASQFKMLSHTAADKEVKAKAYHNLGNSLLKTQKYEESIDAYKNALRNNPADNDTRYNLAYAMQQLRQQQQEQQSDEESKDKKEENKEEKKDNEQQKEDKNDKQQEQQPKDQMTKEEAKRLLEAMEREDKNVQEKLKKQKTPVKVDIEKDW